MALDPNPLAERIEADPAFRQLVGERSTFGWLLSIIMIVIYFGFILLVAYDKEFLAKSLNGGTMTVGIPIGVGVIVSAFLLTGIYVLRANSRYDDLTQQIKERVTK
jgi:uncharacterized membrane protein (DUF485 family)